MSLDWPSLVRYDSGKLIWLGPANSRRKTNDRVDRNIPEGYLGFTLNGFVHRAHNIIWILHHGPIPLGMEVDHIDRVRKNNVIENLRLVTDQQNAWNSKHPNKCGYKGVVKNTHGPNWSAQIALAKGKVKRLGNFSTPEEAARAYDIVALKNRGSFTFTNFPKEEYSELISKIVNGSHGTGTSDN